MEIPWVPEPSRPGFQPQHTVLPDFTFLNKSLQNGNNTLSLGVVRIRSTLQRLVQGHRVNRGDRTEPSCVLSPLPLTSDASAAGREKGKDQVMCNGRLWHTLHASQASGASC